MLSLLKEIGGGDLGKIETFDFDASEIDPSKIARKPEVSFIDGEHTQKAALSDYAFCEKVTSPKGAIAFHDCWIVAPAIKEICGRLKSEGREHFPLKLEDNVFAIFFDEDVIHQSDFLKSCRSQNSVSGFFRQAQMKRLLPAPLLRAIRRYRRRRKQKAG